MSSGLHPVRCPSCDHEFEAPLVESINVMQHPEQRERLLAGQMNVIECPACKIKFHVPRPLLYFDAPRRILVWCYPPTDPDKQKAILEEHRQLISQQFALLPPQLRPRKVRYIFGSLDELIEVVLALEKTPDSQEA